MKPLHRFTALLIALVLHGTPGTACGPWFPRRYHEIGGADLLKTPEFFAEYELKLLAREFPVPFHAVRDAFPAKAMSDRDLSDYDAALKDGSIRPPDAAAARAAHRRMRNILRQGSDLKPADAAAVPDDIFDDAKKAVFPSEFADYHEGALEYGRMKHAAARVVWERLLARPETERKYRSVNAAFMIGVLAVVDDLDDAPKWLAMARELAQKGFHDSCGLAAASYSWESGWHEQRNDLRKAAENALRSISAGYPTRHCLQPKDNSPEELAKFAADPLLRRITTVLLLADHTEFSNPDPDKTSYEPWLAALEAAHVRAFAGAERVAWMCYDKADYAGARRWLARAPAQTAESLWLAGKLAARDGRRAESLALLAKAAQLTASRKEPRIEVTAMYPDAECTRRNLTGDYGLAAINAAEFRTAFGAFVRGEHWQDAAFVGERLLSVGELRSAVAKLTEDFSAKPKGDETAENSEDTAQMSVDWEWLLARRLARCGHFTEARPHFPENFRAALDAYAGGLSRGNDARLNREERAMALWSSALEARYHGMELFGTEAGPDWFGFGGDFEFANPAKVRVNTTPNMKDYNDAEIPVLPPALRAGKSERIRLAASAPTPEKRFHYRYHAADIAWRAAQFLPDNDQRLAEMLDLAGRWIASRDPQAADRFYQALESRCAGTEIGRRATSRRWFVDIAAYTIPCVPVPIQKKSE